MSISVELQRNNITLAQFLASCKFACKQKGMDFNIERDDFENPVGTMNVRHCVKDNKRISKIDGYKTEEEITEQPFYKHEIYIVQPLRYQTYFLDFNNNCFNEICEFDFDDEKTGHGYYYRVEKGL